MSVVGSLDRTVSLLEQHRTSGAFPGWQLYASVDGAVVADEAAGDAGRGIEMTPDTVHMWFCVTKPVGAIALLQLWERSAIELDEPIARHLPAFGAAGKQDVTIRHLLTHTGGFHRYLGPPPYVSPYELVVEGVCEMPLEPHWQLGVRAAYHPWSSWFILAALVEQLDGRPYQSYVREEVFEPLGLDCWVGLPEPVFDAWTHNLGMHFLVKENGKTSPFSLTVRKDICMHVNPATGGFGTMRDIGRVYESLAGALHGRPSPLLATTTIEAMSSVHRDRVYDEIYHKPTAMGLGVMVDLESWCYGSRPSARAFGHLAFGATLSLCDPEHGLVVAALCNGTPGILQGDERWEDIITQVYDDLDLASAPVS